MVRCVVLLAALTTLSLLPAAAPPPPEPPEIAGHIARLGDDDAAVRAAAVKALDALGEAALGPLRRAAATLKDPDVRLRAAVVAAAIRRRLYGEVGRFTGHTGWVYRVAVTPDGKRAVTSGDALRVWDIATGKEVWKEPAVAWSWGLSLSRDGKRVLASCIDRTARVHDMDTGKEIKRFTGLNDEVWVASLSPDGKWAITGAMDSAVRLWDVETGKQVALFPILKDYPRCAAWSPDGRRIAIGHFSTGPTFLTSPGTLRIWDVENRKLLFSGPGHTAPITAVDWSRDGKHILTSSFDRSVRLWDAKTCKQLKRLTVSSQGCDGVAFLPGSQRFIATGWASDFDLTLWDIRSERRLARYEGHTGSALGVAVTPDGKRAVSCSTDGTARVWPLR
jgi:WD40 repeat protein